MWWTLLRARSSTLLVTFREMAEALEHLRRVQKKLDCYPSCHVVVNDRFEFDIGLDSANELRCYLPEDLLRRIIDRDENWNSAEIGCLIEFDRKGPYLPDVHTLMSFFHLPRVLDA